ncbi:molecular chaperone [Acidithiobacillus concretivorus]|uniref:molecular chaperone n=1 Tax=Acidithiobacillus concretivorus TaxID=3063952 RepID=UPI0034A1458E
MHVHLSQQHPIAAEILTNLQDTPLTVQATAEDWSQKQGKNITPATDDLIISPPLFKIPPHGQQIIRVGLRTPFPIQKEGTYRLILHEVPPPFNPKHTAVQVVLKMILPVFVAPKAAVPQAHLDLSAQATAHAIALKISNTGNQHAEITGIALFSDHHPVARKNLLLYVLPASHMDIPLPIQHGDTWIGKSLSVQIITPQREKPIDASVVVTAP